jgi:hypothetical protein
MGDRIQLGPASLSVGELDGDDVKQAALEIDEVELPIASPTDRLKESGLYMRLQQFVARLAERFNPAPKAD